MLYCTEIFHKHKLRVSKITSIETNLAYFDRETNLSLPKLQLNFNDSFLKLVLTPFAWWRHQMETFFALLDSCAGNSPVPGEFPTQRPVTQSFDVFFDLRLNKRLCKQWWGWWFETLSRPLWRHRNGKIRPQVDENGRCSVSIIVLCPNTETYDIVLQACDILKWQYNNRSMINVPNFRS